MFLVSIGALVALALLAPDAPAQQTEGVKPDSVQEAPHLDGAAVWTLYRSAIMDDSARIHVATFDSRERAGMPGPSFNAGNCADAADLFQRQVLAGGVRYWCEKGRSTRRED